MNTCVSPHQHAKFPLTGLVPQELAEFFVSIGEPQYRALQLFKRLYTSQQLSFETITEFPIALRQRLADLAHLYTLTLTKLQQSYDGTIKFLFHLHDARSIETVLIPSEILGNNGTPKRRTLCVSTQVGCSLNCKFCATASLKMKRNLSAGEIIEQFLLAQQHVREPITNLVFMGMGEPMLNYDNVMRAVEILTHPATKLLGSRRITLSTAGIIDGIYRMADERRTIKLALSLHATTDDVRTMLMPINKKYNLRELGNAVEYYYRKTGIPVTYEYILLDGINDRDDDARRLQRLTRRVPSKVNLIPFHPIDFTNPQGIAAQLRPTPPQRFYAFHSRLRELGVTVMVRSSSGKDIHAACGQLALSNLSSGIAAY
ncbi:MAG: 23S rRNA (adenine(2503)-C(2))-methyltransferase RlmN [Bacteroidota bacterium]|nr:23S rRNA (adenine(2503)-C(2))-methyltransferase RlmN [Candidatus Kapabacteria bacterium]MDW8220995.1 23S rRNA (adenine(2503)-C(2))-methyltransferase RlmN [Bacteroidota bacterium]